MSGCALRCKFCHNPDTWQAGTQRIGVADVLEQYERSRHFYDASHGGITLSGGEPLLQAQFAAELLASCQERGIHTLIDTAGHYPAENLKAALPHLDSAMFSIKSALPQKHYSLCGAEATLAWSNLSLLTAHLPVTLRYVLLPGLNAAEEDSAALAKLIKELPGKISVELLPYHSLGREKWQKLGLVYPLADVADATGSDLTDFAAQLFALGIEVLPNR